MKFYQYLYYRLYDWYLNTFGERQRPKTSALFIVSTLITFNIGTIAALLQGLGIIDIVNNRLSTSNIIIFATIIWGINYYLLIYNGKTEQIVERFKKDTTQRNLRNILFLWLYGIGSIVVFFLALMIAKKLKGLG
jgi:hypothetical protein